MAGDALTLVPRRGYRLPGLLLVAAALGCGIASADVLYKYRGDNGEWIYADRPPDVAKDVETRPLAGGIERGGLSVTSSFTGTGLAISANNRFHAPMELNLRFDSIEGVQYPPPDEDLTWVVPARSELVLLELPALEGVDAPTVNYRYVYLPGDPGAVPASNTSYRAPFSIGVSYPVTQTYPDSVTHRTRDSMYAVDIAMPVGTDVVAARDGIVFEVASTNFKGGPDADQYAKLANLVRILHDDGTFSLYAHLNWNTIRVRPGDRVQAGQYIADSGNTGFSSGPHLHFAVQRNLGMRVESLPVVFRDAGGGAVTPASGANLTAYR